MLLYCRYKELERVTKHENTLLLFPSADAVDLNDYLESLENPYDRNYNIILLDGTWLMARGIFFKNLYLQKLKQVRELFYIYNDNVNISRLAHISQSFVICVDILHFKISSNISIIWTYFHYSSWIGSDNNYEINYIKSSRGNIYTKGIVISEVKLENYLYRDDDERRKRGNC